MWNYILGVLVPNLIILPTTSSSVTGSPKYLGKFITYFYFPTSLWAKLKKEVWAIYYRLNYSQSLWDKNIIPSVEAKFNNNFMIILIIVVVLQQLLQLITVLTFWLDVILFKFLASNWHEVSAVSSFFLATYRTECHRDLLVPVRYETSNVFIKYMFNQEFCIRFIK